MYTGMPRRAPRPGQPSAADMQHVPLASIPKTPASVASRHPPFLSPHQPFASLRKVTEIGMRLPHLVMSSWDRRGPASWARLKIEKELGFLTNFHIMRVLAHRVVGRRQGAGKDEAWSGKENATNHAPSAPQLRKPPSSKPIYLSTQPGPGPARIEPVAGAAPLQGSRFGSVALEPLTPRVGYFCPEIHSLPEHQGGRRPDSTLSSTLCAPLAPDAVDISSQVTLAPASPGGQARAASIPTGIQHSPAMRLAIENLTFRDRIGEPGSQGGEVLAALYRDAETLIEHEVAVKRLPAASTPEQLAALEHEAHVMSLVSSRCHHCVRYWGWCQAEDRSICLVMKRYQQSLDAKLKSLPGLKLPCDHVQRYSKQIAQALSELHSQNVLFLDLKPSNILLDEFDNIAVCDFGISQRTGSQYAQNSSNGVFGSFNYMSPEAFDQIAYGAVSTKSDVWSFACVFVEMVSGCRPWKDTSMAAICYKVASNKEIPGKSHTNSHLSRLVKSDSLI